MPTSIAERRRRSSRTHSRQIAALLREQIEADIERLIGLLDSLDGDCDFEPSLGAPVFGADGVDLEGDDSDFEPSLGWANVYAGAVTPASWATIRNWGVRR